MLATVGLARVDKKNKRTRRRANDQMIDEADSDIGQPTGNMRYGDGCTAPITFIAAEFRQWPAVGRCVLNAGDFRLN